MGPTGHLGPTCPQTNTKPQIEPLEKDSGLDRTLFGNFSKL